MGICKLKSNTSDMKAIVNLPEDDENEVPEPNSSKQTNNDREKPANQEPDSSGLQKSSAAKKRISVSENNYHRQSIEEESIPKHFHHEDHEKKGIGRDTTKGLGDLNTDDKMNDEEVNE